MSNYIIPAIQQYIYSKFEMDFEVMNKTARKMFRKMYKENLKDLESKDFTVKVFPQVEIIIKNQNLTKTRI